MLPLGEMLAEPVSSVVQRERNALEDAIRERRGKLVLFGAGNLGRNALAGLRNMGVEPLCFSDNDQQRWGSFINGCPVLAPMKAVTQYGEDALFIVTIWNANHWYIETEAQLRSLGCKYIASCSSVYWRFADVLLPFLLHDLPHKIYEDARRVLAAERLWADASSLSTYRSLTYWYATGDASLLPARPHENSYFPSDIFTILPDEVFVDCGAFDGDTVKQLIERVDSRFRRIHAIEADPLSLDQLRLGLSEMRTEIQKRVQIHSCAVGAVRSQVFFDITGTVDSKMREEGGVRVECIPLDELFSSLPVTMIKMDIEGAEYEALHGAARTIQRDRPVLAICVYHGQSDIWRIPLFVKTLVPEYSFYLRSYEGDGFQTVMYAIPSERLIPNI